MHHTSSDRRRKSTAPERADWLARLADSGLGSELQQARWQIEQFKRSLYGASSERVVDPELSKEQVLLSLFPAPADPPATENVALPEGTANEVAKPRTPRQPAIRHIETVTERIEPADKTCSHCGKASVGATTCSSGTRRRVGGVRTLTLKLQPQLIA